MKIYRLFLAWLIAPLGFLMVLYGFQEKPWAPSTSAGYLLICIVAYVYFTISFLPLLLVVHRYDFDNIFGCIIAGALSPWFTPLVFVTMMWVTPPYSHQSINCGREVNLVRCEFDIWIVVAITVGFAFVGMLFWFIALFRNADAKKPLSRTDPKRTFGQPQ